MRKSFLLLLLLATVPAFGLITTWSEADPDSWNTGNAGAWSGGVPGANDTAVFDGTGAGLCLINSAAVCNRLVISHASQSLTINVAKSLTIGAGGLSFTDGDFDAGDIGVIVNGPCSIVAPAALVNAGIWTAGATSGWVNATSTNAFATWRVSDNGAGAIAVTRTGNVYCEALHIGILDTIKGAYGTYILPVTNDFMVDSGGTSIGGFINIYLASTITNAAAAFALSIGDSVYIHAASVDDSLIIGADWTVGDLAIDTVTFMDSTKTVTSGGNLIVQNGASLTSTGLWNITGGGYVKNAIAANAFNALVISGTGTIIVNRSGNVYAESCVVGTADSLKGAYTLFLVPDVNYFFANGGGVVGGWTDIYLANDATLNGFAIGEILTIRGTGSADSLLPLGAITAKGIVVGTSVTFVDGGYTISSAGNITIHDTATSLSSTGTWNQTLSGTVVNRRTRNAFQKYTVAATCVDTIFYNPTVDDDTFAVTETFTATGTRGSTFLYGKPIGGTIFAMPASATASACKIENIHTIGSVLRAVGCIAKGHMSGVICQQ